jgi:hypothetical protein
MPNYNVKAEFFVEGFGDEIIKDDLVTYKVTIDRKNLEEGKVKKY